MKFRFKSMFGKALKRDNFYKLIKLREAIKTAYDPKVARAKFEKEFIETSTKLLHKKNPSESYAFIKQFIAEYDKFSDEFKSQAEIVFQKGDTGIIGDLYRSLSWTDSRYFIKAKTGNQVGGIWSTYSIIDGIFKKDKEIFEKDYDVITQYVLEKGNDHECYALAKVSNGEILSKLEDMFLKLNNNVFDIKDFGLLNGTNEEKFISQLLEYGDVKGATEVLDTKLNTIFEKIKKDPSKADMYIDLCKKCGRDGFIKVISDIQKTSSMSHAEELSL